MFLNFGTHSSYPYLFHLREQLHSYLDIFERDQYIIGYIMGLEIIRSIYIEKRNMVYAIEAHWVAHSIPEISSAAIYAPVSRFWLDSRLPMQPEKIENYVGKLIRAEHFFQDHISIILETTDICQSTRELLKELEGVSIDRLCLLRKMLETS